MNIKINRRRGRLVVDSSLQNRIIRSISWAPTLALAITAGLIGVFCTQLSHEAAVAQVELQNIEPILTTVFGFLALAVGYVVFNALKFSSRVAGPTYRINRTFESFKEGDFTARANLRRSDFLYEVADGMNDFLDWLETHPPQLDARKQRESEETHAPVRFGS